MTNDYTNSLRINVSRGKTPRALHAAVWCTQRRAYIGEVCLDEHLSLEQIKALAVKHLAAEIADPPRFMDAPKYRD